MTQISFVNVPLAALDADETLPGIKRGGIEVQYVTKEKRVTYG
jgi:hypothetical protein